MAFKQFVAVVGLLIGISAPGQISKLGSLSSAKFLNSEIIYTEDGGDVFGYFLLYKNDEVRDGIFDYECVVLSSNLNRLGLAHFEQGRFNHMYLMSEFTNHKPLYVKKKGNLLYFSLDTSQDHSVTYSLRSLDLKDFTVSAVTYLKDYKPVHDLVAKLDRKELAQYEHFEPTNNDGFLIYNDTGFNVPMIGLKRNSNDQITKCSFYSLDLQPVSSFDYPVSQDKSTFYKYEYLDGKDNEMLFARHLLTKSSEKQLETKYEVIDSQTGKVRFGFELKDAGYSLRLQKTCFEGNQLVLYAAMGPYDKKNQVGRRTQTGYAKITFDRTTGQEIDRSLMYWTDLESVVAIDAVGKIEKTGWMQCMAFDSTPDGRTMVRAEGELKNGNRALFFLVFDTKMKLIDAAKIEKQKGPVPYDWGGAAVTLANEDDDYSDFQKLPDGGFAFYYTNNDSKTASRPEPVLGVVTYIGGKFGYQKISLKTPNGTIQPSKAKNGYILLHEESDGNSELRLEKLDY